MRKPKGGRTLLEIRTATYEKHAQALRRIDELRVLLKLRVLLLSYCEVLALRQELDQLLRRARKGKWERG